MRPLRWYLPAAFWAAGLLVLGSRPASALPAIDLPLDKAAHFLLYGMLGALLAWGWRRAGRQPHAALLVGLAWSLGLLDEVAQGRVAGRSPEVLDWTMDAAGSALAFALIARAGWSSATGRGGA